MKSVNAALSNSIRQDFRLQVQPKFYAEWNFNRYVNTYVYNTPSEDTDGFDVELFPIESIVEPLRPKTGNAKAFTNQTRTASSYTDSVPANRSYLADKDSAYKYWRSPYPSNTTTPFDISRATPTVEYVDAAGSQTNVSVNANKIYIALETSVAKPDSYALYVKVNGNWSMILSPPAVASDGTITLWYNGTTWTSTRVLGFTQAIQGIRFIASSMNAKGYLDVIEIGARLEVDLTADFISSGDSMTMGEADYITPMGDISSNTGTVVLWNGSDTYSKENTSSPYYGLLDKNVLMWLDFEYTTTAGAQTVRQFTMLSDTWTETSDARVEIALVDYSVILQETKPRPVMYQNISVQEAVWRLCDLIGFDLYDIEVASDAAYSMIDIFWVDGTQSLWEIFSELAKATQTAIYFNAYGRLQIKTREAAFNNDKAPVWTLRENQSGNELPDILSLDASSEYEANKVTVEVQPTYFKKQKKGMDVFEVVWEPDGDVTLRGTELIRNIDSNSSFVWIDQQESRFWNYSGIVNIEGEFIKYDGKQFMYYEGTTQKYKVVKDKDEQNKLRAKADASVKNQCRLTGGLAISERGYWNSTAKDHSIDINGWNSTILYNYGTGVTPAAGWSHDKKNSKVVGKSPGQRTQKDYSYFFRGNATDEGYRWLGTRMRILGTGSDKTAGIFFNSDAAGVGSGYYIEVTPSSTLDGKGRDNRNEILFYSQKTDGSKKNFGGETVNYKDAGKSNDDNTDPKKTDVGAEAGVYTGVWFELDVTFQEMGNGDHKVTIAYNGRDALTTTIPSGSGWQHSFRSRSGFFLRGQTDAEFDYFYGITRNDVPKGEADPFFDRIDGSWYAQQWQRDWVYETKKNKRRKKKKWEKERIRYSQRFFDEFGPFVHEVREYDVGFGDTTDNKPVVQSKIFATNVNDFVVMDYGGGPFGARFTIANTARRNVVINGDDVLGAPGSDEPPHNTFFVWGRPVVQDESVKVERTNDLAVAARGEIALEFSSKWLQTREAGKNLADWIITQWSMSSPSLEVEVFGNPLFELTDVVSVQYKQMDAASFQYFVTGIETSWDNGVMTRLTLRRKKV